MSVKGNDLTNLESGFARMAAREWKENRPKLWKALKQRGELREAILEAGRQADQYMEQAQRKGIDYHQAREIALRQWILLPDVDQE
jgi:hypothetical protein